MNLPETTATVINFRIDRRSAIKWMLTAAASAWLLDRDTLAASAAPPAPSASVGYGQDPDLLRTYQPGELWPLTFTPAQRATAAALCDLIIPADARSPAASTVGVPEFIDEWISAPYPGHGDDRTTVIEGLTWLEAESQRRYQTPFTGLIARQKNAIGEDICSLKNVKPGFEPAARFFRRFRDLTAGGFYTTPQGMKDIGYTGNVPLATFAGPTDEVLKKLGLA